MNWNSMCATCHTTAFQKNYDPAADRYDSKYVEQGVGCESCHGPLKKHVEWQKAHPDGALLRRQDRQEAHPRSVPVGLRGLSLAARRPHRRVEPGTRTTTLRPRHGGHGRHVLSDGQIWDEDFEFNVFQLSYMHDAGVRCNNCHSPHTSKIRKTPNELCLDCHRSSMNGRIPIDPVAHGFHPLDKGGSQCIDCHYPQTPYMQRHWRHDHGMTIPDPQLTKEFGLPNACNRCHQDKDVDWSIQWVDKWYGPRMNRPTRERARVLASLKKEDHSVVPKAIEMLKNEKNGAWRAVYLKMLAPVLASRATPVFAMRSSRS